MPTGGRKANYSEAKRRPTEARSNATKATQLGMPFGTACARLKKMICFQLLQRLGEDTCFKCSGKIEHIAELTVEHKKPWQHVDTALFWDLNNIAWSHLACNKQHTTNPIASASRCVTCDVLLTAENRRPQRNQCLSCRRAKQRHSRHGVEGGRVRFPPDRHDQKTSTPAAKAVTRTGMSGPRTAGRAGGESGIRLPQEIVRVAL